MLDTKISVTVLGRTEIVRVCAYESPITSFKGFKAEFGNDLECYGATIDIVLDQVRKYFGAMEVLLKDDA